MAMDLSNGLQSHLWCFFLVLCFWYYAIQFLFICSVFAGFHFYVYFCISYLHGLLVCIFLLYIYCIFSPQGFILIFQVFIPHHLVPRISRSRTWWCISFPALDLRSTAETFFRLTKIIIIGSHK